MKSSVDIVAGYGLNDWGSITGTELKFSLLPMILSGPGIQLASYTMGTAKSFPGVKATGA
jgi:hypothetical protein